MISLTKNHKVDSIKLLYLIPTNFIDTSATPALDNNGPGKISNSLPSASSMDLCPDCFAGRVEIGNHKAFHSYQVR